MTDYKNYGVEDFLHDDFFIKWVLNDSPERSSFWQSWLIKNPDKKWVIEQARTIILSIEVKPLEDEFTDVEIDGMITNLHQQIRTPEDHIKSKPLFYQSTWFRAAAAILLFATGALIFFRTNTTEIHNAVSSQTEPFANVTNNTRKSKLIRMADGSLAVLKPGSALRYLRSFDTQREVYLDGEAFFEIHKNPKMPFRVHSHEMIVKVLGTSFTVRNQPGNQSIQVIVNTGRVMVYHEQPVKGLNKQKDEILLTANQQMTYSGKQEGFKKEILKAPLALSKEVAEKAFNFDNALIFFSKLSLASEKIALLRDT